MNITMCRTNPLGLLNVCPFTNVLTFLLSAISQVFILPVCEMQWKS